MTQPHVTTPPSQPIAIPPERLPRHIALVMDGNGRWARQRGLPRTEGHRRGETVLNDIVEACIELGLPYLTCFAFSTENWKRSPAEVGFILGYSREVLRRRRDRLHELGVRIRWAGQRTRLSRTIMRELEKAEELTADNRGMTLTMCVNYGGRAEIAGAAAAIAREVAAGRVAPHAVTEELVAHYMDVPDMPDVDLFVRTSGEQRISNFLLWQSAYAELVFVDTLFPDFTRADLGRVLEIYAQRNRRFGSAP